MNDIRVPPHSLQAEQAVIGGVLIDPRAATRVCDILTPEDFYRRDHQIIWRAVTRLADRGRPVDMLTVDELLGDDSGEVGGKAYLGELAMNTPGASNIRHYAKIVVDKARRRQVISAALQIVENAYGSNQSAETLLADAQGSLLQIGGDAISGPALIRDYMADWVEMVEHRTNSVDGITGLRSGYRDFDRRTTGLHPGQLMVVAGRPGMGKTAWGTGIAANVAKAGGTALIFSMEMSGPEIVERTMSVETRVGLHDMRSAQMNRDQWEALLHATGQVKAWPLLVDETPALKIAQIRARARRVKHRHGLDLVVVDYLSLAQGEGDSRVNQVGDVSRGLKALAKELQVPVIALSQLNRNLEQRADKRPMISDLRETGQVEQDADLIVFLYRDSQYDPDSPAKNLAEVNIAKHRNGATGMFPMVFLPEIAAYVDAEPGTEIPRATVTPIRRDGGFGAI